MKDNRKLRGKGKRAEPINCRMKLDDFTRDEPRRARNGSRIESVDFALHSTNLKQGVFGKRNSFLEISLKNGNGSMIDQNNYER